MQAIGIDGCRGGWLVFTMQDRTISHKLVVRLADILAELQNANSVFIDIPIGLASSGFSRTLEPKMRAVLPSRYKSSVFTPPCREALKVDSYHEAKVENTDVTGKSIAIQAWNIGKKIKEVDELIQKNIALTDTLFEAHPEICFLALNGGALSYRKKEKEGQHERINVLKKYIRRTPEMFDLILGQYPRKHVAPDDILDALCLCISASVASSGYLGIIEDENDIDELGIPVRVAYPDLTI